MQTKEEERFWVKVYKTDHCWFWIGSLDKSGYGQVARNKKLCQAHRVSYELLVGPIPEGLVLDHKVCDIRNCVNPEHLEPVTRTQNFARRLGQNNTDIQKNKTHCIRGHEFSEENTSRNPGYRVCRACQRENNLKYRMKNRTKGE